MGRPGGVRPGLHYETQLTPVQDFVVSDKGPRQGLTVEADSADIAIRVGQVLRHDRETLAVRKMQHRTIYERPANDVLARSRGHRIEPQGREYQPGRHLSQVIVSGQPTRDRLILAGDNLL